LVKRAFFLAAGLFDETGMNWRAQLEDFLSRTRANAMVLVPPLCDSQELLEELAQREIPTVLISPSHTSPPAHSVGMDDYAAAREITRHLIGLGHRRIGHLSGPDDHVASSRRRQGFIDAMTEDQRAELRQDWILPGLFRFKDALGAAEAMLSSPDRPTAIFAANDDTAAAVCFTAGRMGLQVPEDLSVAGFDDAPIATTVWPPLTTIAQPFDAMAEKIVALLTHEHEPKPDREAAHILGHELKLRGSTAQPPGF
jgi:LacI family transcriptional regulator